MRSCTALIRLTLASAWLFTCSTAAVCAADLEAFEFNVESDFTELADTVNSVNPGNRWSTDINTLTDSFVFGDAFRVAKFGTAQADSYLQIDNIDQNTSGSRFIVATMKGWNFVDGVPTEGEQLRFDFLDSDTGTSGNLVTAQMRIDRNPDGVMELRGTAIGVGSRDIVNRATLNTTQNAPFTMVLELNKSSDTYEVFYKEGNNPSQTLGSAPIAPIRNGNSIRFSILDNFNTTASEFLDIDRFALTDTNPLTDLLTLEAEQKRASSAIAVH